MVDVDLDAEKRARETPARNPHWPAPVSVACGDAGLRLKNAWGTDVLVLWLPAGLTPFVLYKCEGRGIEMRSRRRARYSGEKWPPLPVNVAHSAPEFSNLAFG